MADRRVVPGDALGSDPGAAVLVQDSDSNSDDSVGITYANAVHLTYRDSNPAPGYLGYTYADTYQGGLGHTYSHSYAGHESDWLRIRRGWQRDQRHLAGVRPGGIDGSGVCATGPDSQVHGESLLHPMRSTDDKH